jgi:hypothetical protein
MSCQSADMHICSIGRTLDVRTVRLLIHQPKHFNAPTSLCFGTKRAWRA